MRYGPDIKAPYYVIQQKQKVRACVCMHGYLFECLCVLFMYFFLWNYDFSSIMLSVQDRKKNQPKQVKKIFFF